MKIADLLFKTNIPRWLIFFIDICLCVVSVFIAYLVRFNFSIPQIEINDFPIVFIIILVIRSVSFFITKTYKGIVKHTSSKDSQNI